MHTSTTRSRRTSPLRVALAVATAALVSMSIFGAADTADAMPFGAKTDFATGTNPFFVAVGDLNGDGNPDLVTANAPTNNVSILLGTGTGSFGAKTDFATGATPRSAAIADVNGDGKPDLAVANNGGSTVSILLGNGDGTFATQVPYATGSDSIAVAVSDFDGDGKPDLAVTTSGGVSVLLGNGDGTFATQITYAAGAGPVSVAVSDFNRDGKPDLAVANALANTTSILLGNGDGTFATQVPYATGSAPISIAVGDFNVDGKTDVATANNADTVSVLLGTGSGTFGAKTDFAAGDQPMSVAVGDFNEDGKPDLAVANVLDNTVSILAGTGSGSFATQVLSATGSNPQSVATGDFNKDGKPDLAAANTAASTVSILLGTGFGSTGSFNAKTDFATSGAPYSVAVSDVSGDGKLDLAVVNNGAGNVSILLGTGTGTFGAKTDFTTGSSPQSVAIGDLNGDGLPDLAIANNASGNVSILLGAGGGSFGAKTDFSAGANPAAVAIGDLDRDGKLDLAVANLSADTVSILLGTTPGSFGAPTPFAAGDTPYSVAIRDFNEDGKPDLAIANTDVDTVSVLLGATPGSFGAPAPFAVGDGPRIVTSGDFNLDGKLDLAVANTSGDSVSILLGTGMGSFGAQTPFTAGDGLVGVAVSDFNLDGKPDLVTANQNAGTASVLLGAGTGSLGAKTDFATGAAPISVAIGDLNGDGKPDLAVGNNGASSVSILLQPVSFVVNSSNDVSDGACNAAHCSLREAITAANASAGADEIRFSIGSGAVSITPGSGLPDITSPVTLDGTTQPGSGGKPIVELNGAGAGGGTAGITLAAGSGGSAVRGLVINRFLGRGVQIDSDSNTIAGNYIGTNLAGTGAEPNLSGGFFVVGASNIIGGTTAADRNVISGNTNGDVQIGGAGAADNVVTGNYIGTTADGMTAIAATSGVGVWVVSGGANTIIGGAAPGARNIISGHGPAGWGVLIDAAAGSGTQVVGNYIGVNAIGTAPIPNTYGIRTAQSSTIGGATPGAGNLISGNSADGVQVSGGTGSTILGNSIYTNGGSGIVLTGGGNGSIAAPTISLVAETVDGTTSCSGCTIDVYSDDADEGRVYQGTTTATGTTWSFTGPISGPNVTATVTDGSGNTSPFSAASPVDLLREAGSPGNPGFAGDGGLANAAAVRLNGPHGLFKYNGNLYFADTNNNRIRTITPNSPLGTIDTIAGSSLTPGFGGDTGAATSALLNLPNDVAVDSSGNVYIADTGNCRIRKITGGIISTIAGTSTCGYNGEGTATTAQLNHPYGVAVDSSGNVFIADTDNHRIRKITGGTISTIAGTGTAGHTGNGGAATAATLNRPYDIVISVLGTYVIADTDNNAVRTIGISTGIIAALVGSGTAGFVGDGGPPQASLLDHPEAVAVDGDGDIYIADTNNNRVRHINHLTNTIQTAVGVGSTGMGDPDAIDVYAAHLDHPAGVAAGSVTVSDTGNQTIRVVQTNNDPTGQPSPARPGSGNSCSEGPHGVPLAGIGDWSVIMMTVGLIGAHRRIRRLFQFLSARLRLRPRTAIA